MVLVIASNYEAKGNVFPFSLLRHVSIARVRSFAVRIEEKAEDQGQSWRPGARSGNLGMIFGAQILHTSLEAPIPTRSSSVFSWEKLAKYLTPPYPILRIEMCLFCRLSVGLNHHVPECKCKLSTSRFSNLYPGEHR